MTVEFFIRDDGTAGYNSAHVILDLPAPPRVGETINIIRDDKVEFAGIVNEVVWMVSDQILFLPHARVLVTKLSS
jgi:hypothetical protein